jgi:DNA polymerase-4
VAADLVRKGYVGRTIGIKLRYDDFQIATRDVTIDHYSDNAKVIRQAAGLCLKRVDLSRRLRLLGVRVGKLARAQDVATGKAVPAGEDETPRDLSQDAARDTTQASNLDLFADP